MPNAFLFDTNQSYLFNKILQNDYEFISDYKDKKAKSFK